jgi:dTDP-4-amino-4,6-dideoxygalactose transaminase
MIKVTQTYLPTLEEYTRYLSKIWETNQVTNHGPLVKELELKLKEYLGVKHLFFVANGTIALQIAIKALDLAGDILTTPFSYVATSSSIVWEGCRPVFVDIHPETLNLDPELIEAAITPETTAILATHVYGYPCAVDRIGEIADKHHIKVIYDAAHAFGVCYKDTSLMNRGDVSTLSFHATKLFHTGEGGALITNDDELAHRIRYMLNFGHNGPENFWGLGINGKNSELHAAMGLCILPRVTELIARRQAISELYDDLFKSSQLTRPCYLADTLYNYAYYPVIFPSSQSLLNTIKALNEKEIFPRRYFYPALNTLPYLPYYNMPIAENIAERILCLPLSHALSFDEVHLISSIILDTLEAG